MEYAPTQYNVSLNEDAVVEVKKPAKKKTTKKPATNKTVKKAATKKINKKK